MSRNTQTSVINSLIRNYIYSNINTGIPCTITNVLNGPTKKVNVKPMVQEVYLEGDILQIAEITNVPLCLSYDFGVFTIKPPLNLWVGQHVFVVISQLSVDNYLSDGKLSLPKSTDKFSKNDAFAIPGFSPFNNERNFSDNDNAEIIYNNIKIILKDDDEIEITNGNGDIIMKPDGEVRINNSNLVVKP